MQHETKKEQQEHLESLDKRTKEYKEYKKRNEEQSKGLGDTIAKVTKATGIKKVVEKVAGEKGCGCPERKDTLNRMFPYKK